MIKQYFFTICAILIVIGKISAQTAEDSLTIINAQWQTNVIEKGIVHKQLRFPQLYKGAQNINIIEINMKKNAYHARIIMSDSCDITSRMATENNALVAINGSYYDMKTFESECFYRIDKRTMATTADEELAKRVSGAIVIKKGKVKIIPWSKKIEKNYSKTKNVVLSSGPLMLNNGKNCDYLALDQKFINTKHPRSAIAITNDKKLLLITVDGRSPNDAIGVSIPELTQLLKLLGSYYALNLDGGGSTTLWSRHALGNGVLNCPTDNKIFDNWGERCNSNSIIILRVNN